MIKTEIVGGELPYRIEIDGVLGAADSPRQAALTALRVGGKVPQGCDAGEAALHIFWNYKPNPSWTRLVRILEQDTFEEQPNEEA